MRKRKNPEETNEPVTVLSSILFESRRLVFRPEQQDDGPTGLGTTNTQRCWFRTEHKFNFLSSAGRTGEGASFNLARRGESDHRGDS